MSNLLLNDIISEQDRKKFTKELLKMMLKLEEENEVLKAKVQHLEELLQHKATIVGE